MAGMETFKRGYMWRVGNGASINIWTDAWLPNSVTRKVLTPKGGIILSKVGELIHPITGMWDLQLLSDNFSQIDVNRIQAIPLSRWESEDEMAWHFSKNGMFSVKSAYHIEWNHQFGSRCTRRNASSSSSINLVWERAWKLAVSQKVKIFIWRAFHGIIPCMCVLANRHIERSGQCPLCSQGAKDVAHLLFKCKGAKEIWKKLGLKDQVKAAMQVDRAGSVW
jgi:hypothetical protein